MSWVRGARARLGLLFGRRAAEMRMEEEFRFHLEMETERLVREERLDAGEARRRAHLAFGGVEKHKEALRDGRTLAWLGGLSLDLKLGFRMLVKYPGLTVIAGLAMAFAIWVGAITFELVSQFVHPTLPLPGGDRIVRIRNWDMSASRPEPRALHDFAVWRDALTSVTDLGAFRDDSRNLIAGDGDARQVKVAEVTASAFRIAPEPPLLGRTIAAADEQPGAPPVLVLGHEVWQTRFEADSAVVGRSVQLGDTHATIVGVMRKGFAFPMAHELWMPLRPALLSSAPREGPGINVFGRLAAGVTLEEAQAELTTLGRRIASESPATHEYLLPQIAPYTHLFYEPTGADIGILLSIDLFAILLLVLVCSNVALLLFARAATREGEIVVRSALGASRRRIVMQLFAEALVLGGMAAAIGLVAARFALGHWGFHFLELNLGRLPFWFQASLSPATILYAAGLTVLGAVIAGVVPALKVTRGLGGRLRQGTAGGGGLRFGGVWTAVIVAQVAVTVAFPVLVFVEQQELRRIQSFDVGFAAEEYLGVRLEMEAGAAPAADDEQARLARRDRFVSALETLRERVATEPGVAGVTFVDRLPRMVHLERLIEVDEPFAGPMADGASVPPMAQEPLREVSIAHIDPSYFAVLRTPVLAGRPFHPGDLAPHARVAIVDQGFVNQVLLGRNPIGQRVRFAEAQGGGPSLAEESRPEESRPEESRPWLEIVGVVKDLGMGYVTHRAAPAGLYLPAVPGSAGSVHMVVHAHGDPMLLGPRVRALTSAVDPTLRISDVQRVDRVANPVLWLLGLWLRITLVLAAIALLLSLAGIYAVLSFTVARRTREIGVRVALGASRPRVVATIFRRPLAQVGAGVAAGGALVAVAVLVVSDGGLSRGQLALLVAYAGLMLGVCLLACIVPTRRALRVEPTVALRAE